LLNVLVATTLVLSFAARAVVGQMPTRALYEAVLPENPHDKQVAYVEIAIA
jgi:hypothetical protein